MVLGGVPTYSVGMQVTITYLFVGLIVGFAAGLGAARFLWHRTGSPEKEEPLRVERRPARYSRSYEPSTPPQHRPSPRPRPVTALHHPNPIPAQVVDRSRFKPASPAPAPTPPAPIQVAPAPAPAPPAAVRDPVPDPDPEPFRAFEFRPAAELEPEPTPPRVAERPAAAERAVSFDTAEIPDRQLLNDLLESNRRLTEDAEVRLRREGSAFSPRVEVRETPQPREQPEPQPRAPRPAASAPAQNDLLARHRKLEEDSRRMSRRAD